jgi:hypothetical protein
MPQFIARAGVAQDRLLLGLIGIAVVSLALMAAIVGNRISTLPDTVVLHLNAAGVPDLSGSRSNLWRLPLAITMMTVMNAVGAWFFLARDAFVSRLILGVTLLIHVLAWMAVFQLFW